MNVSLIVAVAQNRVIGKNNQLIWKLADDLKHFKRLTSGHSLIMGRKTFDSIGKPLPDRTNIVISRNAGLSIEGCEVVHSIKEALALAKEKPGADEAFIIGGAEIYRQALSSVTKAYVTQVMAAPEGDAFFDIAVFENWKLQDKQAFSQSERNEFDFEILYFVRS